MFNPFETLAANLSHSNPGRRSIPRSAASQGLLISLLIFLPSCGGGSGGGSVTPPPSQPAATVSVSVSPLSASVQTGGSQQFSATVTGSTNTSVTWTVNGVSGGNSTVGQVSSNGLYAAPAAVPGTNPVTIAAVSQADPTKSGSASIQITTPATISVKPATASVFVGSTQQFQVTLSGPSNTAVTWAVNGVTGGNAVVGTVSNKGLYTAPAAVPAPSTVTLSVTSQASPSLSGAASVTVLAASSSQGSLSPVVTMQNSPGFTLTVNGSGFSRGSQVEFNGVAQTTTFVSSSQLTAPVSSSDLTQAGTYPVTVVDGGTQLASFAFYVVPGIKSQTVSVNGGVESPGVNITLQADSNPQLALLEVGAGNNATTGGAQITPGTQTSVLVVGSGLQPGDYFEVPGDGGDVTLNQPVASDFITTTSGQPAVRLTLTASSTAAPGPRNLLATNPAGEVAVFVGAVNVGGP